MSAQLSKLHVRFIQSQKSFLLLREKEKNGENLPITQLYVKDKQNFYFINMNTPLQEEQNLIIQFREPTPALNCLDCGVHMHEIQKGSEEYEETLLFFNVEASEVNQLLLLTIEEISSL